MHLESERVSHRTGAGWAPEQMARYTGLNLSSGKVYKAHDSPPAGVSPYSSQFPQVTTYATSHGYRGSRFFPKFSLLRFWSPGPKSQGVGKSLLRGRRKSHAFHSPQSLFLNTRVFLSLILFSCSSFLFFLLSPQYCLSLISILCSSLLDELPQQHGWTQSSANGGTQ